MIAELRGSITNRSGDLLTVMTAAGIGYEVAVPIGVLERLSPDQQDVRLHTSLVVREDSWALFGFDRALDRQVFQRLLQASGVGPRLALNIVSSLSAARVVRAVREGDLAALCTVPGVGKKKAERLVLELKDRVGDLVEEGTGTDAGPPAGRQAVAALLNLGYGPAEAEQAVQTALARTDPDDIAGLIRTALQGMNAK